MPEESFCEQEAPKVLNGSDLPKKEKEKIRRVCTPKPDSGRLEVPDNIFEMWEDAAKGRETIFKMWAKSGGVKACRSTKTMTSCMVWSPF